MGGGGGENDGQVSEGKTENQGGGGGVQTMLGKHPVT